MRIICYNILSCFFYVIIIFTSCTLSAQVIKETVSSKTLEELIIQNKYSNLILAKSYANILLEKYQKESNEELLFISLYHLGEISNIEGNYNDAISYSNSLIQIAKKRKNNIYLFEALLIKGNAYYHLGNNEEALSIYMEASTIAEEYNDIAFKIKVSESIAKIKERIGHHKEALRTYRNNLKLTRKVRYNTDLVISTLMGIERVYLTSNMPDSTLHYSKMGLEISENRNNLEVVSYFYNDMGKAYFKKGFYNEAIKYFKKSEGLILKLNNKTRLTETCYFIGYSYYKLIDLDNAIIFFKKVEQNVATQRETFNNDFNPPELQFAYKFMAKAYKMQDNDLEASNYSQKYIELYEHNDHNKNEVVKELFVIKENELQSSLNLALNEKNKVRYLLLCITLITLFSLFAILKSRKNKKQNNITFQKLLKATENIEPKRKEELTLTDEKAAVILLRLDKLEETHYFLNTNCNLRSMAKKLKTNTTYLSKIIHKHKQQKFYQYINGLRIHYAIQRLKEDRAFRNYSVEYISQELGYKSTNSFTKHFKAHTKLYPSYYIKNLNEYEKKSTSN